MKEVFNIWQNIENLTRTYNLSVTIFLIIYLFSFVPFYLGYFLILRGSTREMSWGDFFRFRIKKLKWNNEVKIGIFILLFGFTLPYVYILFWGRGLPLIIYILIIFILFGTLSYFCKRLYKNFRKGKYANNRIIIKKKAIESKKEMEGLWKIYDQSFLETNRKSPCRQNLRQGHFFQALKNPTVFKYILFTKENNQPIGIAMVTNNLKNSPWISEDYFKSQFPKIFSKGFLYYFMGIAILEKHRGRGHAVALIEKIIQDLPKETIMGFDHSFNANRHLPYFTKIISQSRFIKRKYLDKQRYYIVFRKK